MSGSLPTVAQVAEMRALVVGRETPEVAHRLADIRTRLADGAPLDDEDRALLARVWHEYGHELAELLDPEG